MSLSTMVQLNDSIMPSVPFIWYRETELSCPLDHIYCISKKKVKEIYDVDVAKDCFIVVQKVLEGNDNLYLCLHSLMFYHLTGSKEKVIVVSPSLNKNMQFMVDTKVLEGEIVEMGLKQAKVTGNCYIHNAAFSPPGVFHFRLKTEKVVMLCHIVCNELNVDLFVIFELTR